MPDQTPPRGTIVLSNAVGRALRKAPAAVGSSSAIDCCGDFHAGETINVTFRGIDGGQFAVATAIARVDAMALREQIYGRKRQLGNAERDTTIIAEKDLKLLWPR